MKKKCLVLFFSLCFLVMLGLLIWFLQGASIAVMNPKGLIAAKDTTQRKQIR